MLTKSRATIEDLHSAPEGRKAELVNGELVLMRPTGGRPGRSAGKIFASLERHEQEHGGGCAFGDNVGFRVDLPDRESFSPDAAWHLVAVQDLDMDFAPGAPAFAAEVRSKNDYGPEAEAAIAAKRRDYFLAGARVVWDVDLWSEAVIRKYTSEDPEHPIVFRRGDEADAEPAVPGWRMPVNVLFG